MKKMLLAAAVGLGLSLAMTSGAFAAEKTLRDIHGSSWPVSQDGFVTKNQCLQCHGPYDKLAKQTENLSPNPHASHLGAVNCEDCHKADKAQPELMCNQCHQFKVTKDQAPAK